MHSCKDSNLVKVKPNSAPASYKCEYIMEKTDVPDRSKRELPAFMYKANYLKDSIGSGGSSYGGALDWITRNQEYANQFIRLLIKYPHLIEEKVLDVFWDFIQPLVINNNLLLKYDQFLQQQFGFHEQFQIGQNCNQPLPTAAAFFKPDMETKVSDYTYPIRRAFVCYDRTSAYHQGLKHLFVDQLEPFMCVRTNPTKEQANLMNSMDICRNICGSIFIMLINDTILNDETCLHLLSIAIAYKAPIVFVRESAYLLPQDLKDEQINFVSIPESIPFTPKVKQIVPEKSHKTIVDTNLEDKNLEDDESEDVGLIALKKREMAETKKNEEMEKSVSLAAKIKELYSDALIFSPLMFEMTLGLLYDRISAYTGIDFGGFIPQVAKDYAQTITLNSQKLLMQPLGTPATAVIGDKYVYTRTPEHLNRNTNNSRPDTPKEASVIAHNNTTCIAQENTVARKNTAEFNVYDFSKAKNSASSDLRMSPSDLSKAYHENYTRFGVREKPKLTLVTTVYNQLYHPKDFCNTQFATKVKPMNRTLFKYRAGSTPQILGKKKFF